MTELVKRGEDLIAATLAGIHGQVFVVACEVGTLDVMRDSRENKIK
jgi:hypothetical protein